MRKTLEALLEKRPLNRARRLAIAGFAVGRKRIAPVRRQFEAMLKLELEREKPEAVLELARGLLALQRRRVSAESIQLVRQLLGGDIRLSHKTVMLFRSHERLARTFASDVVRYLGRLALERQSVDERLHVRAATQVLFRAGSAGFRALIRHLRGLPETSTEGRIHLACFRMLMVLRRASAAEQATARRCVKRFLTSRDREVRKEAGMWFTDWGFVGGE